MDRHPKQKVGRRERRRELGHGSFKALASQPLRGRIFCVDNFVGFFYFEGR